MKSKTEIIYSVKGNEKVYRGGRLNIFNTKKIMNEILEHPVTLGSDLVEDEQRVLFVKDSIADIQFINFSFDSDVMICCGKETNIRLTDCLFVNDCNFEVVGGNVVDLSHIFNGLDCNLKIRGSNVISINSFLDAYRMCFDLSASKCINIAYFEPGFHHVYVGEVEAKNDASIVSGNTLEMQGQDISIRGKILTGSDFGWSEAQSMKVKTKNLQLDNCGFNLYDFIDFKYENVDVIGDCRLESIHKEVILNGVCYKKIVTSEDIKNNELIKGRLELVKELYQLRECINCEVKYKLLEKRLELLDITDAREKAIKQEINKYQRELMEMELFREQEVGKYQVEVEHRPLSRLLKKENN